MRGPELHTLLVSRPDPLPATAGRTPASGAAGSSAPGGEPSSSGGHAPPATEPRDGIASRRWRYLASGGYQVHNGRPAAPVVNG
jgi:hypothetical protein